MTLEKFKILAERYQKINFYSRDGLMIEGAMIQSKQENSPSHPSDRNSSNRVIIFCHGRNSNWAACMNQYLDLAISLINQNFALLFFSFRGHGNSAPADYSFGYFEQYDVQGALQYLYHHHPSLTRIGFLGYSLGAMATMLALERHKGIKAVVCESGYSAYERVATFDGEKGEFIGPNHPDQPNRVQRLKHEKGWNFEISAVKSLKNLGPCALFLIDGEAEKTDNHYMYNSASGPKELWLLPQASHGQVSFLANHQLTHLTLQFFLNHV